jgi:hypothetical protein
MNGRRAHSGDPANSQSHPAGCNSCALSCVELTAYSTDRTEHELLRHELLQRGASRAVAARATRSLLEMSTTGRSVARYSLSSQTNTGRNGGKLWQ